jgi:hypothetical protein
MTANNSNRRRVLGYAGDARLPFAQRGWEDARLGRPFDYAFVDAAPAMAQATAYELARFRVMALRDSGHSVPAWRKAEVVPSLVRRAMRAANATAATYWPRGPAGWMPAA